MIIRIDVNSDEPLYIQLMNQIKFGVAKGYLKPNQDLPSVRSLAGDLGINMHTVSKAYNELKNEGILIVNRRKGVMVNTQVLKPFSDSYPKKMEKKLRELVYESKCNGITTSQLIEMIHEIESKLGEDR